MRRMYQKLKYGEDPGDYKEEVPETGVDSTERTESSNMFPVNTVLNS